MHVSKEREEGLTYIVGQWNNGGRIAAEGCVGQDESIDKMEANRHFDEILNILFYFLK